MSETVHNNKCEGMLTSQGQLLRKMGPLTARDGERPKCIQAYFYGADQATAYRMMNCKVSIPSKERETYRETEMLPRTGPFGVKGVILVYEAERAVVHGPPSDQAVV